MSSRKMAHFHDDGDLKLQIFAFLHISIGIFSITSGLY